MAEEPFAKPTVDDLRKGMPFTLLSGIEVRVRPVSPDRLVASNKLPDMLTPVMLKAVYGGGARADLDEYVRQERDEPAEIAEWVRGIDAVCEAALVEPDIVPMLSLSDRLWLFRWAFLPTEALKNFRYEPFANVDAVPDEPGDAQQAEPDAVPA